MNTKIVIRQGQRALLRISNLNVTRFYTVATTGLRMKLVGTGAHILRGPGGASLYTETSSVTWAVAVRRSMRSSTRRASRRAPICSTRPISTRLSNGTEDFGGMMTEIEVTAP